MDSWKTGLSDGRLQGEKDTFIYRWINGKTNKWVDNGCVMV